MKKLTILLVLVLTMLFTCSNTTTNIKIDINNYKAEYDIKTILAGEFSIIEEINALASEDKKNVLILALNIFHEARGENLEGQIAITNVVFNRVKSEFYPNNITEVVYQNKQFSWTDKQDRISILKKENQSWVKCQKLAFIIYTNSKIVLRSNYLHYVNKDIVNNLKWAKTYTKRETIGRHIFLMKEDRNA